MFYRFGTMKHQMTAWVGAGLVAMAGCAAGAAENGEASFRPLLYAAEGAKAIQQFDDRGRVVWEYPAEMARDAWRLPSGHVLFCYNDRYDSKRHDNPGGVTEVTPDKTVVFHFQTTGQVWSCQRMADGQTMVGASSQGKLLVVNPQGKVTREIRLKSPGGHSCIRNARALPSGNFLVAEEAASTVREYNPQSEVVWEKKLDFRVYSAVRLPNGRTLVCGQKGVVEVDAKGAEIWRVSPADIPEVGVRWLAGLQALPDGGVFLCNAGGKVPFFELGSDHKIRWQCPPEVKVAAGHGIQRLDIAGAPWK